MYVPLLMDWLMLNFCSSSSRIMSANILPLRAVSLTAAAPVWLRVDEDVTILILRVVLGESATLSRLEEVGLVLIRLEDDAGEGL